MPRQQAPPYRPPQVRSRSPPRENFEGLYSSSLAFNRGRPTNASPPPRLLQRMSSIDTPTRGEATEEGKLRLLPLAHSEKRASPPRSTPQSQDKRPEVNTGTEVESSSKDDGATNTQQIKKTRRKKKGKKPIEERGPTPVPRPMAPRVYPDKPNAAPLDEPLPTWSDLGMTEEHNGQSLLDRLYSEDGFKLIRPQFFASRPTIRAQAVQTLTSDASLMERLGLKDNSVDVPELLSRIHGYTFERVQSVRLEVLQWIDSIIADWRTPCCGPILALPKPFPLISELGYKATLLMPRRRC
jgi:hypothetical protein